MGRVILRQLVRLIGVAAFTQIGCADDAGVVDIPLAAHSQALGESPGLGPKEFRDYFYTVLHNAGYADDTIRKLVLLPPSEVDSPFDGTAQLPDRVDVYDRHFESVFPRQLYRNGLDVPFAKIRELDATLADGPVTMVVVPEIFGEYASHIPFEDITASPNASSYARKWQTALRKASSEDLRDVGYSMTALGMTDVRVEDLVQVASIDDPYGRPLVNLINLKPLRGMLETVGSLDDNARAHFRRLGKVFRVLGTPERFYLLGFSRGTTLALSMASLLDDSSGDVPEWSGKLSGVISLGGVIYGAPLADSLDDSNTVFYRIKHTLQRLSDELQACEPDEPVWKRAGKVASNTVQWTEKGVRLAALLTQIPVHQELFDEHIGFAMPSPGRTWNIARGILFDDCFQLDAFASDYCANVDRFKLAVSRIFQALEDLSTPNRLEWFRTHTLPSRLKYFALTATMGDASKPGQVTPEAQNATAYDVDGLDLLLMRETYYENYRRTGVETCDGLMPLHRARFWPGLHAALNPRQQEYPTYFLGTVGSHHIGLGLPSGLPMASGHTNPFPRAHMLRALAAFVARVEQGPRPEQVAR